MKNGLGNLAARDVDQLAAIIKNRLKRIQYRPALIGGFLAQTGLTLQPRTALAGSLSGIGLPCGSAPAHLLACGVQT